MIDQLTSFIKFIELVRQKIEKRVTANIKEFEITENLDQICVVDFDHVARTDVIVSGFIKNQTQTFGAQFKEVFVVAGCLYVHHDD
ncbi:hypothetical protein D3C87_1557980 [compost metagenome]